MDEEVVALYDDGGRPDGSAPRSVMRAHNLRHGATGILVRDPYGRVYAHRRTPTKDVYPAYWDFTAGGVLLDGEDPTEGARRELAEELGVTSEIEPLGEADYADDHTRYRAFRFVTTWDGPITPQPEEVAYGAWLSVERLLDRLADPEVAFMPDTRALFGDWLRERAAHRATPYEGQHSVSTVVEDRWVDRTPRSPAMADPLCAETRLLPRVAPLLPLDVPQPILLDESPLRVRHHRLPGEAAGLDDLTPQNGLRLGHFLRALHDLPVNLYVETGVPDDTTSRASLLADLERMLNRVLPLLPEELRPAGQDLLRRVALRTPVTLVHGDLAAHHLLVHEGEIGAVVGWTSARTVDPAADLAWPLFATPEPFAEAVATAYGVTDDELGRALDLHRLVPWYDVLRAQRSGDQAVVESGLSDLGDRLDVRETA